MCAAAITNPRYNFIGYPSCVW